jgi:hypothetical protein
MIRFGLHMTLRSGREALARLLVTMGAVAVGVGLLLCVLSMYHAYETTTAKPCWQCTDVPAPAGSGALLWHYGQDVYGGDTIDRLDVSTLSASAPVLPGLDRLPAAGQYYASPAMAALLRSVPADQLGDRYPGSLAGTVGPAALSSPDQLVIVIGRPAADLTRLHHTLRISQIQTAPRGLSTSEFYRFGFALGTVALLVPMLVLVGTASRMAAARREERYAALRLIGATTGQVSVVASVDAAVGAVFGAMGGLGIYALLHPLLAGLPLLGSRFFAAEISPSGVDYVGALVAVPAAAVAASVLSLRRVRISPLGVTRRATPPPPRAWRVVPLLVGISAFCIPLLVDPAGQRHASPALAVLSLILVMVGLLIAGPWLTMRVSRVLARYAPGGSGLLAARRLADNARAAFRAVSGLVLAVLVGTALAAIVPAAIAAQSTTQDSALRDVLRVGFDNDGPGAGPQVGLSPATGAALMAQVAAIAGTHLLPVYHPSPADDAALPPVRRTGSEAVISCADLQRLPALGSCAHGLAAVVVDTSTLYTDNLAALNRQLPLVNARNPGTTDDLAVLAVSDLLITTDSQATLERVRSTLSAYAGTINRNETPMTFGEIANIRAKLYLQIQRMVSIIAAITMLIAGCSLAVAVSGSLVERKRPFTLMRVTGVGTPALYRAVLLETVLPLLAATGVAAGVGMALAYPIARVLAPDRHVLVLPQPNYLATLGAALLLAIAVIASCLPLLGRITHTDNARFE